MSTPPAYSADVDALYKLPLGEFTAARNALVARLKKAGRQAEADEVKALPKPSVSAWVVNQLYWRHRASFDRMIEAGERQRRAQAGQLNSASARELVDARRKAVAALAGMAPDILRDGSYGATRDVLRRVASTLEALSTYGARANGPAAGRLEGDVDPPGFEVMAALAPSRGPSPRAAADTRAHARSRHDAPANKPGRPAERAGAETRREQERKGFVTAAKAAVREAERTLRLARKRAERAAAALESAATRVTQSDGRRAEIEARLARAAKEANAAREEAREATVDAEKTAQAVKAAERGAELARERLRQLDRSRR
jgi:hypothetical protein